MSFSNFRKLFVFRSQSGQLMVEILVAITVGGVLLVAATAAMLSVIRNNFESRSAQASAAIAYDLINKARSFATSDWHNIYNLNHGSSYPYYIIPGATSSIAVSGQESVLSNDVAAGLVGHWKMDEATGTIAYDSSGNTYNGSLINSPTRTASSSCMVGNCLTFDGSTNYVNIGVPETNGTSQITVAGWFKRTGTIPSYYSGILAGNSAQLRIQGTLSGSQCAVLIVYTPSPNYVSSGCTQELPLNEWHHIAATYSYSGGTATAVVYYDGKRANTYNGPNPNTIGPSGLAGRIGYVNSLFPGLIDDVRVYNRALSANEISQIYNSSVYTRSFYVSNVSRTGGVIDGTYNSANDDPSTQQINATVTRSDGTTSQYCSYVTRPRDSVFAQSDWSGGGGVDGPITIVSNAFSSSTNITAGKTFALTSFSASGTLISPTLDTQDSKGAAFNTILWNGSLPSGTSVQFQIASANTAYSSGGTATGSIDTTYHYAWNDKIGWIDFGYASGNVAVQNSQMVGYANNDDIGLISLDCGTSPSGNICVSQSNYKVSRDPTTGNLSGWAWNDEIGWISFSSSSPAYNVNVNLTNGAFTGYAWNDIIGWISFNCSDINVCGASNYRVNTQFTTGWQYIGPDGTGLTYYTPSPGASSQITLKYHNNYRYFKYKVILNPDSGHTTTPTVNGIIINWSP